jgi:hypothetical protein
MGLETQDLQQLFPLKDLFTFPQIAEFSYGPELTGHTVLATHPQHYHRQRKMINEICQNTLKGFVNVTQHTGTI